MAVPDLHRPTPDDALLQEVRRVGNLLEQLVAQGEERRAGERQMEALGAMLAGGDSQASELSDHELLAAFYRNVDGSYGIGLGTGNRPATPEETQRLEQLVGRKRRRS